MVDEYLKDECDWKLSIQTTLIVNRIGAALHEINNINKNAQRAYHNSDVL